MQFDEEPRSGELKKRLCRNGWFKDWLALAEVCTLLQSEELVWIFISVKVKTVMYHELYHNGNISQNNCNMTFVFTIIVILSEKLATVRTLHPCLQIHPNRVTVQLWKFITSVRQKLKCQYPALSYHCAKCTGCVNRAKMTKGLCFLWMRSETDRQWGGRQGAGGWLGVK